MSERHAREVVTPTAVPRLMIAPSTMDLLASNSRSPAIPTGSYKLKNAPKTSSRDNDDEPITYVLIDCPPSLNLLTINALAASDAVLVPLQCEFFALEGLSQLLKTVDQVRARSIRAHHPRNRADDVRPAQFVRQPGRRRRARLHGRESLRHRHSAQTCASRRRPRTASRCCSMTSNAPRTKLTFKLASEVIQREGRWRAAEARAAHWRMRWPMKPPSRRPPPAPSAAASRR